MALFTNENYEIINIVSELKNSQSGIARNNRITFGLFEEFLSSQYFTVAKNIK